MLKKTTNNVFVTGTVKIRKWTHVYEDNNNNKINVINIFIKM